jgi:hypothetical protein
METVAAAQGEDARVKALHRCLTTGTGECPTPLAAFDAAPMQAGVTNYNLLCVSSVILPVSEIVRTGSGAEPDDHESSSSVRPVRRRREIRIKSDILVRRGRWIDIWPFAHCGSV